MSTETKREEPPPSQANDAGYWRSRAERSEAESDRRGERLKESDGKLKEALDQLKGLPDLQKKVADLEKSESDLKGTLRQQAHRSAFDRAAKKAGADEDGLDDLWKLSGYEAKGDQVDDKAIGSLIDGLKESKKRFFGSGQPKTPPPAGDRGGDSRGGGKKIVTRAQLKDRAWVKENEKLLADPNAWEPEKV